MLAKQLLSDWPAADWRGHTILVGVSGGADSIALLRTLCDVATDRSRIIAAHFNHRWREAASDGDEQFVIDLCQSLGVACITNTQAESDPNDFAIRGDQVDSAACVQSATLAKDGINASESKKSEESARQQRYEFFIKVAYAHSAGYVATAHTADDRIETLLHNLFRGSGLAGAASLKMFRSLHTDLVLVRPLLAKSRADVIDYLEAIGQTYRDDASNVDESYRRNYLRHSLLPALRQKYPEVDQNLLGFSRLAEDALRDVEILARQWLDDCDQLALIESDPAWRHAGWRRSSHWICAIQAPSGRRSSTPWTVIREALRLLWLDRGWPLADMTQTHWELLRSILLVQAPDSDHRLRGSKDPAVRTWSVLPGAIAVQQCGRYVSLSRAQGQPPLQNPTALTAPN